jgi:uroporphyrinogen decarboxylase
MESRERFLRTLSFDTVDRPFSLDVGLGGQAADRFREEGMPTDMHWAPYHLVLDGNEYFGFERVRWLEIDVLSMLPPFDVAVLEEDERDVVMQYSDGHVTRALKEGYAHGTRSSMDQYLSWAVSDGASWEDVKRRFDAKSRTRYPAWWEDLTRCLAARTYPLCVTQNGVFGLFSRLRALMGTENACTVFYDDPALAHDMLDYLTDYLIELITPALQQVEFDFFNYFEDMAFKTGPLVGPNIFRKFLAPRYRRINDHLRAHGVQHIWLDSDGNTEVLIPLMIDVGITCHWPLERAAGMDPLKIRSEYGHDLALAGGIDKRPLANGPEAIDEELYHHVPQLIEDGGYIPMIDHTVPPDVSYQNWLYYLNAKHRIMGFDWNPPVD